ncbi:MAG TPA: HNH endonuclease signature motif containing protein, partial [Streptosporangiaceae bacterium]
ALAPGLRYDQLARKAVAVAMKLDPEAFTRGKEQARQDRQRVQAGREESGNAFLSGRELAIEDALASKAHIDALAVALRRGGLPGTLQRLRVVAFNDLTQGRDPLDRLPGPRPADRAGQAGRDGSGSQEPSGGAPQARDMPSGEAGTGDDGRAGSQDRTDTSDSDDASWDGCPDMTEWQHERRGITEDDDHPDSGGVPSGPPAPFPALINLTVPAGNILGWSAAPGEAGSWGLTDPGDTRRLVEAASRDPRTRWCATLLAPDGIAIAHGCARGPHPWIPPPADGQRNRDGPDARQAAALADLLRDLNVTFTPIARGTCDHASAEDRYVPSRKLKHLVRARTATCPAPGCGAQAVFCDLDHTLAYPAGITCQCDLAPPCRRHHRVKQAPGWTLTQPEPGVMHWQAPSGRSHTTTPTVYEM